VHDHAARPDQPREIAVQLADRALRQPVQRGGRHRGIDLCDRQDVHPLGVAQVCPHDRHSIAAADRRMIPEGVVAVGDHVAATCSAESPT
jgi:hypothetical protein